ncbi:hypothetical protein CPC735_045960 [Coccidioides posadasii C735 delta SOWgp]|uniref:Uncharacterized protein n=1 Tax=Coccidioides posadasii (strain C735) TaxID=222929 RepID=C5PF08_COCP7|nr:hypothetical protein CPC735_045960 [Coccidioides posadasii C735 delta SOWgp]
MGQGSIVFHYY